MIAASDVPLARCCELEGGGQIGTKRSPADADDSAHQAGRQASRRQGVSPVRGATISAPSEQENCGDSSVSGRSGIPLQEGARM